MHIKVQMHGCTTGASEQYINQIHVGSVFAGSYLMFLWSFSQYKTTKFDMYV